jgi:2-polyprenyl-3-methyl-5-hydroxy-6-metoxy-1,4-benzoquinol methylase
MFDIKTLNSQIKEADYHIKSLENISGVLRDIKFSLEELRNQKEDLYLEELESVKQEVQDLAMQLKLRGLPLADEYEKEFRKIEALIKDDKWPVAINPEYIVVTKEDEEKRAKTILDLVVAEDLSGVKFLDCACEHGHIAKAAEERGACTSVGFDWKARWKFEEEGALHYTNQIKELNNFGPFDVILLYDTLDHIPVDPIVALRAINEVASPDARIYVRNHPWTSPHGGHLYEDFHDGRLGNKAWLHLVLDEIELMRLGGYKCKSNIKATNVLETYRYWFEEASFEIKSEIPIKINKVDDFFLKPEIKNRINKNLVKEEDMLIEFVDYILEPKLNHQIL